MKNMKRSDVSAKQAFVEVLKQRGFDARIAKAPADIVAVKDGVTWYFEIKRTSVAEGEDYFGAATITEWAQALKTPEHFRFVVAYGSEQGEDFDFREYTPQEFLDFSTVPPFKIFFSVPARKKKTEGTGRKRGQKTRSALRATETNLRGLETIYEELKHTA